MKFPYASSREVPLESYQFKLFFQTISQIRNSHVESLQIVM
jgi:hypothetical protein